MTFENVALLLPDRTVGYGMLETSGSRISKIALAGRTSPSSPSVSTSTPSPTSTSSSLSNSNSDSTSSPLPSSVSRLILPGLVNCHGHTAMTLLRGTGGGLPLQRWLEEAIFPIEARMTPDDIRAGVRWGALEMLAGGTTQVIDMYDFPDAGEAAFESVGLKASVSRVGLSFVPGRLEECIAFTRAHPKAHVCVHSEYLTDEPFCRALADANNRELKRPVHVHVSETEKEHRECLARHGQTPVAYLASTGLFDCGGFAAHGVWCTDDDFRILKEKRVILVHNPSSNMKLGSGFARIPRAWELGVTVALGTDGCASNDNLDLFEEMHLASLIHKGLAKDPTVLSPWDVIEMATCGNRLAVGAPADFCVVDLARLHLRPALDLPNLVVHSMHASDVVQTVVDGRLLYDHGTFPTVDLKQAREDFDARVRHCHGI